MSKELLLMADVPNLGTEGQVVKVADGYARNYLLPRKLAAPVTPGMRRRLAKLQQDREVTRRKEMDQAQARAETLNKVSLTIAVKTVEGEKLYGSVTAADVVTALKTQGIEIGKDQVELPEPIKELGVFNVTLRLQRDITATIKLWVVEE